jgi:hypothetical protein
MAGLAKPKLVKQIPGSTTFDYLVDHATYLHVVVHVQWNAHDSVGVGQYVLITGNTKDVSGVNITMQELWYDQRCGQSRFNVKKTFRHIFDNWASQVNLLFIINPKFFTFW